MDAELARYLVRDKPDDDLKKYLVTMPKKQDKKKPEAPKEEPSGFSMLSPRLMGAEATKKLTEALPQPVRDFAKSFGSGAVSGTGSLVSAGGYLGKKLNDVNPVEPKKFFKQPHEAASFGGELSNAALAGGSGVQKYGAGIADGVKKSFANDVASGLGSMIPYLAAGYATAGASSAPLIGGLLRAETETQSNAAQAYQALLDKGMDEPTARRAAMRQEWPDRIINAALEPFGALSNKGRLVRTAGEAVQEGVLQEPSQSITQNAAMKSANGGLLDFGRALWDEAKNYPEYFKEVGLPAMVAGGLVGGLTPGTGGPREQTTGTKPQTPAVHRKNPLYKNAASNMSAYSDSSYAINAGDIFIDKDGMRHTVKKVGSTGLGLEAATGKKSGMTFEKFEGMGMQKLTPQEIAGGKGIPSIEGIFGPAYDGYEGKPIAAASKLLKEKTGEVKNAFTDPDGENIDYTYGKLGEEGYGIGHIAEKHGKKILVRIPEVVLNGKKIRTSDNRVIYVLGDERVIVKEKWNNQEKRLLVTAYENEKENNVPSSYGRTTDVDQFSPRDDSPSGLNGNDGQTLATSNEDVNSLSSVSREGFEPKMPDGTGTTDIKVGDVKRIISDTLGIPVREGQIRKKGVMGFINHSTQVIRSKSKNDMATLLHEFGHAIDRKYKLSQTAGRRFSEFDKFGKAMGYAPKLWQTEGLAQFYQWRGIDPKQAYEMFPEYSKVFDEFLASNPEARQMIEGVFNATQSYYNATPQERLKAAIGGDLNKKGWGFADWAKDVKEDVRDNGIWKTIKDSNIVRSLNRTWLDRHEVFTHITNDVAKVGGWDADHTPDRYDVEAYARTMPGTLKASEKHVAELLDYIKGITPDEYEKIRLYLVAGGAIDYYANGMNPGVGLSLDELQQVRFQTGYVYKLGDSGNIASKADFIRSKFSDISERLLVDNGLVSQEMFDAWKQKYPNYVPMIREENDGSVKLMTPKESLKHLINGAGNQGYVDIKNPVNGRRGAKSERDLLMTQDPMQSMLMNIRRYAEAGARNQVGLRLVEISKLPGLARIAEKVPSQGENTFYVWDKGHKRWYATDPDIYRAVKVLGDAGLPQRFVFKFVHRMSEVFKAGTTRLNPWFIVKNLMRDAFTVGVQSDSKITDARAIPIVNTFDGILRMVGGDPMYLDQAKNAGLFYSSMVELTRENIPKLIDRQLKGGKWHEIRKRLHGVVEKVGNANETVELAPKFREFMHLIEKKIPEKRAAMMARGVNTDFQRAGEWGRQINFGVPFFNAQVQGLDKAMRTFAKRPAESLIKTGLYIILPSVLEWAMYHDDDDYKALDKQIKDNYWLFRLPGMSGQNFVRLPMPFEFGVIFGGGAKRALDKMFMGDEAAGYKFADSIVNAVQPSICPTLLGVSFENWANKDMYTGNPIVPLREQKLPNEQQYGSTTSWAAKKFGQATGISPRKVDNTIKGLGGTIAGQAVHAADVFDVGKAPMPAKSWSQKALFNPYTISSLTSNHYVDRFYDVTEELEKGLNGAKAAQTSFSNAGLSMFMKSRRAAIGNIWKQIAAVRDSQSLSPQKKKELVDTLSKRASDIAERALNVYDKKKR